jgi:transposase
MRCTRRGGRDSIAPEKLLRALTLQVLYGIRSERLLVEQLGYNLLFRWFVGVSIQDDPWDHSTFSKNRDWLIEHEACRPLREVRNRESCGCRNAYRVAHIAGA